MSNTESDILVIGAGIAGITAALESAEAGKTVLLIEREASLGGRVSMMNKYFPKLCPPLCGLEINYKRLRSNRNIKIMTQTTVGKIDGKPLDYTVELITEPRFVNSKCVSCADCEPACPVTIKDRYNMNLSETKAIYLPHMMSMPHRYLIDKDACKGKECSECVKACKYDAINLDDSQTKSFHSAKSIIVATGWKPYDPNKIANLNYGSSKKIVTNVEFERISAVNGPSGGKLPEIKKIGFIQCAGSRDENNLHHCSSVCCMASLKQATYVRDQYPDAEIYIFYIDIRTPGKYEYFYETVTNDEKIHLLKGKVAKIEANDDGTVSVHAEDIMNAKKISMLFDLVVLATGMEPEGSILDKDDLGFSLDKGAIFATGVAKRATDVTNSIQDATGSALRAIKAIDGGVIV